MLLDELIVATAVGLFFAVSGWHKLFNRGRHRVLVETLRADGIPWVRFNEWWVPVWELLAGSALALSWFLPSVVARLSASVLMIICLVAMLMDGLQHVRKMQPLDWSEYIADLLYLPECLLALLLVVIII